MDVNAVIQTIETGIAGLAKSSLQNYLAQAKTDGQTILNAIQGNLQSWTSQLASGALSAADLKFLIQGQQEVVEMAALTQAGATAIQLDQFKQGVIDLIVKTVSTAI
jgi:hypothetical protein